MVLTSLSYFTYSRAHFLGQSLGARFPRHVRRIPWKTRIMMSDNTLYWLERGLNLWPWDYESPALPLSYRAFYDILSECSFYSTLLGNKLLYLSIFPVSGICACHLGLKEICCLLFVDEHTAIGATLVAEWLMQRAHNSPFFGTFLGSNPSQCKKSGACKDFLWQCTHNLKYRIVYTSFHHSVIIE